MNREFWHRRRVLVTGGCGFVGRWVARTLAPAEVALHVVDLAPSSALDVEHSFHHVDLRNLEATSQLLAEVKPSVVIHLAGQPGVGSSHDNPAGAFEANVLVTFNMLEACRAHGKVEAMVAVSSNHVYGDQHRRPTPEDAPLNGHGMYAASKLAGDVLARAYGKDYGVPVGIARMTNSYGGDDHHRDHIITATILSALNHQRPVIKQSGRDRKGYLYIKDTAAGLLALAEGVASARELRGEAFNLVPNEAVTVLELVRKMLAITGRSLEPRVEKPDAPFEHEHLDNAKARRSLAWTPRYDLETGLRETVEWFSRSPESPLRPGAKQGIA